MSASFPTTGNGNGNNANVTTQGTASAAANLEIRRNGNTIRVGDYEIVITKDSMKVRDVKTGKTFEVWGDPHLHTGDGDKMSFTENNITINLPGGVKITVVPTEKDANGAAWIDRIGIIAGDEGMMIHDVHGSPRFGQIRDAATVDSTDDDGLLLRTGAEIDDLFSGDREFVGGDPNARWGEHDLDQLAQRGWLGGDDGNAMTGDKYDRLYAVLAKLEQMKERQLTRLGKLLDDKEQKDTLQAAKSEWISEGNSAESFPGNDRLEKLSEANLESQLKFAEMELQRTESLLTQTTTLISNLVANDGQTAMRIIGNIRMG
jgi:hypothetical protein